MFDSIFGFDTKYVPKELIKKQQQNNVIDVKMNIVSLAYTDKLTSHDLYELSDLLSTIAQYKSSNKKKGL